MIDLFRPYVPKNAIEAVVDVLRGRNLTQGQKVEDFEKSFKEKFNVKSAVSMNSGTAALETAYELIGLKPGDEVITTPLTCTATNLPLVRMGVKLVWADILERSLCIDPEDVRRKITQRTRAVVQVHLGGLKADVGQVAYDDQGIPGKIHVVSDACQALGIFNGDYTCCSFQAIKHVTTVDGGMLVCNSLEEERKAKLVRWFGIDRTKRMPNTYDVYKTRKMTYDIEVPGTKRHMNDVSAAMGLVGLEHYREVLEHRRRLFRLYRHLLDKVDGIKVVDGAEIRDGKTYSDNYFENVYWLCTVLVERRDDFAKMMFEADVDVNLVHTRNDTYKIFGGGRADLPVMNRLESKYISLPLGMHVTEEDVHYICDKIKGGW